MMLRRIDGACDSLLFVSSPRCENTRLARLLRTRYEGTRPCAANTVRNWSRLIEPSLGAQDHGSIIAGQGRAPQQKRPLNVRFGGQAVMERRDASLRYWIIRGRGHEHADAPHPLDLLRARRKWPRRHAAVQRDELARLHWVTRLQGSRIKYSGC